jgi:isopenicillin-N epimerase
MSQRTPISASLSLSRRDFLKASALTGAAVAASSLTPTLAQATAPTSAPLSLPPTRSGNPLDIAKDETYWQAVAAQYKIAPEFTQLENGYYGILSLPVLETYQQKTRELNEKNAYYLRRDFGADYDKIRAQMATFCGVDPAELAFTRGATEALQRLITGYTKIKSGDHAVVADLDYDSMLYAFNHLEKRMGVELTRLVLPQTPSSEEEIVALYRAALKPNTRLILLTHINHRTGMVLPVRKIADMAREKGIDTIVDAAHSFAHLDFKISDLGADFVGVNLHKWFGAPLGTGMMYIRKNRLPDIDTHFADADWPETDIRSRIHTGTAQTANILSVPRALEFHNTIGSANKQARLRYLRDYWVSRVRDLKNVKVLVPDQAGFYGAITSFRALNQANQRQVATDLLEKYKIFTVRRSITGGDGVRVTPSLFTLPSDLDKLVSALREYTA